MIPLVDLKAQYHSIRAEVDAAIHEVLESSQFVLGEHVANFERDFARYCGVAEAIALNSGTSALHLALLAAGVGTGDEVITVPFTFAASVAAILYTGARPVLVDVDAASFNMDPALVERAITPRTKAILPVDLFGHCADMDPLADIARRHSLILIEDAAQAHGAEYKGRRAGSLGDIGCFSFYPTKNLGAYGEGGMVVTDNPEYAKKVRLLRNWGEDRKYHHALRGYNYRMEGMQGAILGVKLRHLERWTEQRRAHATAYNKLLAGSGLELPKEMQHNRHVYHTYTVRSRDRDELQKQLTARGVQTAIHYPTPVHLQPAYMQPEYHEGSFSISERLAREVLSLPIYPEMTREQLEKVAVTIAACVAVAQQTGAQSSASGGATAGAEKGAAQGQTAAGTTAAGDVQTQQSPEGNKGRQVQPTGGTAAGASTGTSTSAGGSTSANAGSNSLAAGTSLDAELTKSIDARKAKQGDPVEARVRNDVKQDGKVVIRRGSKLIGHVTQAQAKAKGDAQSALGILFDRVQGKGGETMDVHAAIQAIAAPRASAMADEGAMAGGEMSGPAGGAGMPQGGGGALGGVGNTVGGAARTAGDVGSAAGQTVGGASQTVGGASQTVGGAATGAGSTTGATAAGVTGLPGVQISNQLSNSTNGSVLVSNDKNLHLDSGTQMVLRVISQ